MPNTPNPSSISTNAFLKAGGFDSMNHFMQCYGLRMYNDDDVQEAKAIIAGMRANDQAQYVFLFLASFLFRC